MQFGGAWDSYERTRRAPLSAPLRGDYRPDFTSSGDYIRPIYHTQFPQISATAKGNYTEYAPPAFREGLITREIPPPAGRLATPGDNEADTSLSRTIPAPAGRLFTPQVDDHVSRDLPPPAGRLFTPDAQPLAGISEQSHSDTSSAARRRQEQEAQHIRYTSSALGYGPLHPNYRSFLRQSWDPSTIRASVHKPLEWRAAADAWNRFESSSRSSAQQDSDGLRMVNRERKLTKNYKGWLDSKVSEVEVIGKYEYNSRLSRAQHDVQMPTDMSDYEARFGPLRGAAGTPAAKAAPLSPSRAFPHALAAANTRA